MASPPEARPGRLRALINHVHQYFEVFRTYAVYAIAGILLVSIIAACDPNTRRVVFGVWHVVQVLIALLSAAVRLVGHIVALFAKLWCVIPGLRGVCQKPITLEFAAHRVKHTATVSLDVFESFAHDIEMSRADSVSYVDLWTMSDTASELGRSADMPEAVRLAGSLVKLKDTVMHVEDGVGDINRAGWQAFTDINRWIGRVHDEIVRQHDAGVIDAYELHMVLGQMATALHAKIEDLLTRIDKTYVHTTLGLQQASEVRRDALEVHAELTKRRDDRSMAQKMRETWSRAVQKTDEHLKNVLKVKQATNDLQAQLRNLRGHLKLYTSNADNFKSEINAMEILSLKQELKELEQLGVKIQKVLDEAKQMNSEGHDAQ